MPDILSHSEIEMAIESYSRTSVGRNEIKARLNKNQKFVAKFQSPNQVSLTKKDMAAMRSKAQEMVDILYKHIISDTASNSGDGLSRFSKDDIIVSKSIPIGNTGNYKILISFNSVSLHRDSLDPDSYPNGIDNIIKLFVHGYSANGRVTGEWHGEIHASLQYRSPNSFMQNAVDEFNNNNAANKVKAELDKEYL